MIKWSEHRITDVEAYWGERCPMMCIEETAELVKAISKLERALFKFDQEEDNIGLNERMVEQCEKDLVEEVGDMYISLAMIMRHYYLDIEDVQKRIDTKLNKEY